MKLHYLLALITSLISCTTYTVQQSDSSKKLKREEQAEHKQAAASFAGLEPAPAMMVVSTQPARQQQFMNYFIRKKQEDEKLFALHAASRNSTKRKNTNDESNEILAQEFTLSGFFPKELCQIINDYYFNYQAEFCPAIYRNVILKQDYANLEALIVSRDGTLIVCKSPRDSMKLWDGRTGKYHGTVGRKKKILGIACNNNTIVTLSKSGTLKIWHILTSQNKEMEATCIKTLRNHLTIPEEKLNCVNISQNGKIIVTGSANGTIQKYSRRGKLTAIFKSDAKKIIKIAISADGKTLASLNTNRKVQIFDTTGQSICLPLEHDYDSEASEQVHTFDISADGNTIITGTLKTFPVSFQLWSRTGKSIAKVAIGLFDACTSLAADGNTAFMSSIGQPWAVWDAISNNFTFKMPSSTHHVPNGAFRLFISNDHCRIFIFDTIIRRQLASMKLEDLISLKKILTQLSIAQGFNPQTAVQKGNSDILKYMSPLESEILKNKGTIFLELGSTYRIQLSQKLGIALFALPLNLQQNICAFFDITETHEQFLKRTAST